MTLASCSTSNRDSKIQSSTLNGDVKLLYLEPAENWTAGFPVGNGILGAMVLGGIIILPKIRTTG